MKFILSLAKTTRLVVILACSAVAGLNTASAGLVTQIPDPFTTETFSSFTFGFSQFDTSTTLGPTDRRDFATVYDNFSFGSDLQIKSFSWVGAYQSIGNAPENTGAPVTDFFTINVYDDLGGEPGSVLASFNVGQASETAIAGFDGFYQYQADISPLAINGGETYWFSAVANLDSDLNSWGIAFSDIGDDLSYQDFGLSSTSPVGRFMDPVDYAFSVTAVPEPSSALALLLLGVGYGVQRRRRA